MPKPPKPPRLPTPPALPRATVKAPRAPRLPGPLRLSPIRNTRSVRLDRLETKDGQQLPPFVRFDQFMREFRWRQGEHLTTIGPTGSGKTVLNRHLLARREYVVILGVKNRDPELYGPFEDMGYELLHSGFDAEPDGDGAHILFVPRAGQGTVKEKRNRRTAAFRAVLSDAYEAGGWCIYVDDTAYVSDQLRLRDDLEEGWMLARSEGISIAASSQEPVNIPVMAYSAATHLFLFKNPDLVRARRMAELTGVNRPVAEKTILELPDHEFLYINKSTGKMVRSMVLL